MITVREVCEALGRIAPLEMAEEWDNVGLLLGDLETKVEQVVTCLTLTEGVADEAARLGAQLIVSHHPVLFKPQQRLTTATAEGRTLLTLLRAGIAVYSPHTAYDNAPGGINDQLAERIGLTEVRPLRPFEEREKFKIVVFVPESDLMRVSDALFAAGAGIIGQYEQCSFRLAGTGTFFGLESTNPTIGQKGRREEVTEYRLEVVCPAQRLEAALSAMRKAHSYEEPAFDVYPLKQLASAVGVGRCGSLAESLSPLAFARRVADRLDLSGFELVAGTRAISRVAVVCGAGGSLLRDAISAGVDALLTGELRFHDQVLAHESGLTVALAGHFATERPGIERLAELLQTAVPGVRVSASAAEKMPTTWVH